ncbi:hypothetical protein PRJ39_03680 [Lysobacter enzymogenes]|uniref:hypothetical protein n=1 Tax=Lysobacter enzymogenes TaxID=69 RepID=UPI0037493B10
MEEVFAAHIHTAEPGSHRKNTPGSPVSIARDMVVTDYPGSHPAIFLPFPQMHEPRMLRQLPRLAVGNNPEIVRAQLHRAKVLDGMRLRRRGIQRASQVRLAADATLSERFHQFVHAYRHAVVVEAPVTCSIATGAGTRKSALAASIRHCASPQSPR